MARSLNIFHNLVTDENSTTELLCNLMRFAAFRRPLLTFLFQKSFVLDKISFEDISTQATIERGRPDIFISNDDISALIEVKVTKFQSLTENQPDGYFSFLAKQNKGERWLVFLVPKGWRQLQFLQEAFEKLKVSHNDGIINTAIKYWEDVIEVIEDNDLQELNPFLNEFYQILVARHNPEPITFNAEEVIMLFNKNFPTALAKLDKLIGQIQEKGSTFKSTWSRDKKLRPEEYGIYFEIPVAKKSYGLECGFHFGKQKVSTRIWNRREIFTRNFEGV
jgi:hypothetical protein